MKDPRKAEVAMEELETGEKIVGKDGTVMHVETR